MQKTSLQHLDEKNLFKAQAFTALQVYAEFYFDLNNENFLLNFKAFQC